MLLFTYFFIWESFSQCEVISNSESEYTISGDNCNNEILEQFKNNQIITSITIHGLNELPDNGFQGCSNLQTVNFEDVNIRTLPQYIFHSCSKLTNINIPSMTTNIGQFAFQDCTSLKEIELPDGLTSIGTSCFMNCKQLIKIEIPEDLRKNIQGYENEEVILGIRPENITASETDGIAKLFPNSRCEIEADVVELLGHELIVYGFLNSQRIIFKTSANNDIQVRDKLKITFDMRKAHFFDPITTNVLVYKKEKVGKNEEKKDILE